MGFWHRVRNPAVLFPFVMLIIMAVLIVDAAGFPANPRQLPLSIAILTAVLLLIQMIVELRKNRVNERVDEKETVSADAEEKRLIKRQITGCFLAMPIFLAINYFFGFLLASILFIGALSWFLGFKRKQLLIGLAVGIPIIENLLFVNLLRIPLPTGMIWRWFGV
jgi:small-conductance mechanosensitive channel